MQKKSTGVDAKRRKSPPASRRSDSAPAPKAVWQPGTMLFPLPVVMIVSTDDKGKPNICTVAWTGTVCSEPPMLSISLRKERYSYDLISASREFTVNVPSVKQVRATDYCGVVSGRDVDKFAATKLTPAPGSAIKTPIISECPISLECRVTKTLDLGSHTMFLAKVLAVQVTETLLNAKGRLALEKAGLAAFAHGGYYVLGKKLGFFGFSVQKKKSGKK